MESRLSKLMLDLVKNETITPQEAHVLINATHYFYNQHFDHNNEDVQKSIGTWGIEGLKNLLEK